MSFSSDGTVMKLAFFLHLFGGGGRLCRSGGGFAESIPVWFAACESAAGKMCEMESNFLSSSLSGVSFCQTEPWARSWDPAYSFRQERVSKSLHLLFRQRNGNWHPLFPAVLFIVILAEFPGPVLPRPFPQSHFGPP